MKIVLNMLSYTVTVVVFLLMLLTSPRIAIGSESANTDVLSLLNNGKGIQALRATESLFEKAQGAKRAKVLIDALDVCILTQNNTSFIRLWDKHWKSLYEYMEGMPKVSREEKDLWSAAVDSINSKAAYRSLLSIDQTALEGQAELARSEFYGNPNFEYASFSLIMKARVLAILQDRQGAQQKLRQARALLFQRNMNMLSSQEALATLLETSLNMVHDTRDIHRWFEATRSAGAENGISLDQFFNPYIYARIIYTVYQSGVLDKDQDLSAIETLHSLYNAIEIEEKTLLHVSRESFYAFLALEQLWHPRSLTFDPIKELYRLEAVGFDGIGVRAYLDAIGRTPSGQVSREKLQVTLKWLDGFIRKSGPTVKRHILPTREILLSLSKRIDKKIDQEVVALESFMVGQIDFFKAYGYRVGDNPPALTRNSLAVSRYALERMKELRPSSGVLKNFALFIVVMMHTSRNSEEQNAYRALSAVNSELAREQLLNLLTLNERYGRLLSDVYFSSAVHMVKTRSIQDLNGATSAIRHLWMLELYETISNQLKTLRSNDIGLKVVTYENLLSDLGADENGVFSSSYGDFLLTIVVGQKDFRLHLGSLNQSPAALDALGLLRSSDIASKNEVDLKAASIIASRFIFGPDSPDEKKKLILLSGPTFQGVPYTLFRNIGTDDWLVRSNRISVFNSYEHYQLNKKSQVIERPIKLAAFANPKLRSATESASVLQTASLIRGAPRGVLSLPELPETEAEIRQFAQRLKGRKEFYFQEQAKAESLFELNFNDIEILAFSSHGVLAGEVDGARTSAVVLSPSDVSSGLISAEYLFSIKGAPKVALLSMCNSGSSETKLNQSEVSSISSAFTLKGTQAVMASYWQVNSAGTFRLMELFGSSLSKKMSYSEAFQQSIRELSSESKWSHPAVWAAFVFLGDYPSTERSRPISLEMIRADGLGSFSSVPGSTDGLISIFDFSQSSSYIAVKDSSHDKGLREVPGTRGTYVRLSTNQEEGIFYLSRVPGKATVFSLNKATMRREEVCSHTVSAEWLLEDFFVSRSTVFGVYSRKVKNDNLQVMVFSQPRASCQIQTLGPHSLDYEDGVGQSQVFLYPGEEQNQAVLIFETAIKAQKYQSTANMLNSSRECSYSRQAEYHLLNDELKVLNHGFEEDLSFNRGGRVRANGIRAVWTNSCSKQSRAKTLPLKWFSEKYLITTDKGEKFRSDVSGDDRLVNENFGAVIRWWAETESEIIYVLGSPSTVSVLFNHQQSGFLSDKSRQRVFYKDFGFYAYSRASGRWTLLFTEDACSLPQPIAFDRVASGVCTDFSGVEQGRKALKLFSTNLQ
jgi:hypothetical protein